MGNCSPAIQAKTPTSRARYSAHLRSNQQICAELGRSHRTPVQQHTRGFTVVELCHLPPRVFDLQESQDHVEQRDQPERERRVDAAGDQLRDAQQPLNVEMLGPQAGNRDATRLEP